MNQTFIVIKEHRRFTEFASVGRDELLFILDRHWKHLGGTPTPTTSPDRLNQPATGAGHRNS